MSWLAEDGVFSYSVNQLSKDAATANIKITFTIQQFRNRESVDGIAISYGLDRPGFDCREEQEILSCP